MLFVFVFVFVSCISVLSLFYLFVQNILYALPQQKCALIPEYSSLCQVKLMVFQIHIAQINS